jgi:hypothetical protein
MTDKHFISIWFFIGSILTVYGVLILGAGIYDYLIPPEHPVVLNQLHAGIWWGFLLLLMGILYVVKFFPDKNKS